MKNITVEVTWNRFSDEDGSDLGDTTIRRHILVEDHESPIFYTELMAKQAASCLAALHPDMVPLQLLDQPKEVAHGS